MNIGSEHNDGLTASRAIVADMDKHALSNPLLLRSQEWCFVGWCRLCLLRQRARVIMSVLVSVCSEMNLSNAPTNGANKSHVTKWTLALVSMLQNEDKWHYQKNSRLQSMCLVIFSYSIYPTRERRGSKCSRSQKGVIISKTKQNKPRLFPKF